MFHGWVVLSVDEIGYLFIDGNVDRDDLVGICEQLMAMKQGWA